MLNQRTRGFIGYFFSANPTRTTAMVGLLAFSGLSEAVGVATLLPVLELGTADPSAEPSAFTQVVGRALSVLGIEPTLGPLLILITVAMALKGLFRWLAMREVGFVVARVAMDMRLRLLRALMKAEWRYFTRSRSGFFSNSISYEAHLAANAYREACAALAAVFQVAVYAIAVVLVSWKVAVAALVVGSTVMFVLRRFVEASRQAGEEQRSLMRSLVARLTDALPGLKPLKAMARERYVVPLLESETQGFYRAQQKQVLASESLLSFQEPVLVAALALGLYGVLTFTPTPFSIVLVLSFLFYRLVTSLNNVQLRYNIMVAGESAFWSMMENVQNAEDAMEVHSGTIEAPRLERSIRLEGVHFSYDEEPVLRGVSLEVPAGSFVAISGRSGSGKTTLADLIIGLLRPSSGRILVDGVDLAEVDPASWRSRIGYVPQDLLLFHDSIERNVTLGNDRISREKVEWALEAAGAREFVESLPGGVEGVVGERGGMLSGGQRQRIAIARALVEDPKLLVLDEATTALDPETEAAICDILVGLKGHVTILAISHQPALRSVADVIFEVEHGGVETKKAATGSVTSA
ncbi:MAG: ABC transporter ATP-binding protein [Gemmatimonadota bacterium]|jgi:ATP-binding cassette subfamily C protein